MRNRVVISFFLSGLALLSLSCKQEEPEYAAGDNLGQVYLSSDGGMLNVLVSLDGLWRVGTDAAWIRLDGNGGKGQGAFTLYYEANSSDIISSKPLRKAHIIIQRVEAQVADTLTVLQQGAPDGGDYRSISHNNYLEFIAPELKTRKVLYVNLSGASESRLNQWMTAGQFDWVAAYDPDRLISDENGHGVRAGAFVVRLCEEMPEIADSDESFLAVKADGWNLVVADFGSQEDAHSQYGRMKGLLDRGYNRPLSGELWIIGGSLYHFSVMENGYPDTPSWYPNNPSDERFDADRYAWECNLYDSIYLTHKRFNTSFSAEGKSWRADYAYVSASAWNHLVSVETFSPSETGLQHAPCVLTLKY